MELGHLFTGEPQADAPGAIGRARLYDTFSAVVFAGRRRRTFGALVDLSGAQPGDRVLDVGCGPGYLTALAARAVSPGGEAVGIDPSAPMINRARRVRGSANCSFELGKAEALAAPDESFDVVVSSLALHHVPEPGRATAVREMFRVLRPGGRIVLADYHPSHGHFGGRLVGAAMRHNPVERIAPMIRDAGFAAVTDGDLPPFLYYVRAIRPETRVQQ